MRATPGRRFWQHVLSGCCLGSGAVVSRNRSSARQRGQMGIIAALLALGLAAAGITAVTADGHRVVAGRRAALAAQQAGTIFANAETLYAKSPSGWVGVSALALVANGAVPRRMVQGDVIVSPFGTPVGVSAGYDAAPNDSLLLTYTVPRAACAAFALAAAHYAAAVQVGKVDVQNEAAYSRPGHGGLDPIELGQACVTKNSTVIIKLFSGPMPLHPV